MSHKRKTIARVFLVYLTGSQEAEPEEKDFSSHNHSLLSSMRLVVRRGRVPAPLSGHGRPQGTGPPVPALVDPPISVRRPALSRGFATLTQQMSELNMHANNIDESLSQHIQSTQNWQ